MVSVGQVLLLRPVICRGATDVTLSFALCANVQAHLLLLPAVSRNTIVGILVAEHSILLLLYRVSLHDRSLGVRVRAMRMALSPTWVRTLLLRLQLLIVMACHCVL
jgi:hypothetical protein